MSTTRIETEDTTSLSRTIATLRETLEQQARSITQIGADATDVEIKVKAMLLTEVHHILKALATVSESAWRIERITKTLGRMRQEQEAALVQIAKQASQGCQPN